MSAWEVGHVSIEDALAAMEARATSEDVVWVALWSQEPISFPIPSVQNPLIDEAPR